MDCTGHFGFLKHWILPFFLKKSYEFFLKVVKPRAVFWWVKKTEESTWKNDLLSMLSSVSESIKKSFHNIFFLSFKILLSGH
jgi:hypothetical protein